jgi:hypothetical protein
MAKKNVAINIFLTPTLKICEFILSLKVCAGGEFI